MLDKLVDTLIVCRRDGHDGNAELGLEHADVDAASARGDLVHHVERDDKRHVEFHELQAQVEIALDVRTIDDVDDGIGFLVEHELARDDFLARIGRERVDARQVRHRDLGLIAYLAVLAIDCHARKVADVLVRTGQRVEERRLARILIADESEVDGPSRRNHMPGGTRTITLVCTILESAIDVFLAKGGMQRL